MIPMHTPQEAIDELRHCHDLGLKVVVFPEGVMRPLDEPAADNCSPWLYPGQRHWFDCFALDSIHDYDPVWAACEELGFAATFHGGLTVRPGLHWSITSYVANHIGQFAAEMYPLCKALLLGGATTRFPRLPFVFLECGASWAAQLLTDTIGHWEKRNGEAIHGLDPSLLDRAELASYWERYGGRIGELMGADPYEYVQRLPVHGSTPDELDEFVHLAAKSPADIVDRFAPSFYFGCEADDRGVTAAFARSNPCGAELGVVFSSDIGHWDVPDMAGVVAESYELVEDGHLTEEQWRRFTYDNPLELFTRVNPSFFDGTSVAPHVD
jgi:predicted TIM-barrel fold metal-dependent hydrolase